MSLPEFKTTTSLTRQEAINQIISSIAMEELGLSHIINAEGEKLQYVLGTIDGVTGPNPAATIEDVLKVNESVRMVLQGAAESQSILRNKLQTALSSAVLTGPTGPAGPTGPSIGTIIPYASGLTSSMDTAAGTGLRQNASAVGFGSADLANASANQINLNTADFHAAFSMPAKGTVTAMTALFSATEGGLADVDSVVSAQLYQSTAPDTNIFNPIPDALIKFEPIKGVPTSGMIRQGMLPNLKIPVDAGIRLLMVFYLETPGHTAGGTTITGFLSGSIMIK